LLAAPVHQCGVDRAVSCCAKKQKNGLGDLAAGAAYSP